MSLSLELKNSIKPFHLLNHPFYQRWMEGRLSLETLQEYAKQYYIHIKAFPRYISATHSQCEDINDRRILMENLMDEEGFNGENHPELWLRFGEGLGLTRQEMEFAQPKAAILDVIQTFMTHGQSSYHEGLSALYAYEYQVPEIAESKIEGLTKHYNINDKRTLDFFETHKEADVFHRKACESLIDSFKDSQKTEALKSAKKASQALWNFLSSLEEAPHVA